MGFFSRNQSDKKDKKQGIIKATGHQAFSTLEFFSGFYIIKKYAGIIRQSNKSLIKGDEGDPDHVEETIRLAAEERRLLANRVLLEAGLYFFMGTFLVLGCIWNAASHPFSDVTIFWVVLAFFAGSVTLTIALVKAWQSHNVRSGEPEDFKSWFFDKKGQS